MFRHFGKRTPQIVRVYVSSERKLVRERRVEVSKYNLCVRSAKGLSPLGLCTILPLPILYVDWQNRGGRGGNCQNPAVGM